MAETAFRPGARVLVSRSFWLVGSPPGELFEAVLRTSVVRIAGDEVVWLVGRTESYSIADLTLLAEPDSDQSAD